MVVYDEKRHFVFEPGESIDRNRCMSPYSWLIGGCIH